MKSTSTGGVGVLFMIALVLGILKLTGHVAISWWWIVLIWPVAPLIIAFVFLVILGAVASGWGR